MILDCHFFRLEHNEIILSTFSNISISLTFETEHKAIHFRVSNMISENNVFYFISNQNDDITLLWQEHAAVLSIKKCPRYVDINFFYIKV